MWHLENFVVDSQVKIWSCTLSDKNSHLTLLCFQHHFGTILTIFAKLKYHFDFDKLAITLQPSRNEELCPFPILIEKYRVLQLLRCEKSQRSWRSFQDFPYQNLIVTFLSDWKRASATYNILQAELFLVDFLINIRENCHFWSCSISHSFVGILWHISRKQLINFLFWFWHRKSDTRLYSYTSSYLFHIKLPIIY